MLGAWTNISPSSRFFSRYCAARRERIPQLLFYCIARNAPMLFRQGELHERGVQPAAAEHFVRRCMGMDRLAYRLPCAEEGVNGGFLWTGPYGKRQWVHVQRTATSLTGGFSKRASFFFPLPLGARPRGASIHPMGGYGRVVVSAKNLWVI